MARPLLVTALALGFLLAGCGRPGADGPGPSEGDDPVGPSISGPEGQAVHHAVREFAASRGVEPEAVAVSSIREAIWSDASLGCPEPGKQYAQVQTPGYIIEVIAEDGSVASYHSDKPEGDRPANVIRCDGQAAPAGSSGLGGPALARAEDDLRDRLGGAEIEVEDSFLAPVTELVCDDATPAPADGSAPRKVILEFHLKSGAEVHVYRAWADDILYCGTVDDLAIE